MAIVMQVIMFNGSPVKRLLLNAEGVFVEEPKIDMQNDGSLYVHSAHVDVAEQSVQPTCATSRSKKVSSKSKVMVGRTRG